MAPVNLVQANNEYKRQILLTYTYNKIAASMANLCIIIIQYDMIRISYIRLSCKPLQNSVVFFIEIVRRGELEGKYNFINYLKCIHSFYENANLIT